ncbi:unnamed protein product [Cercospora beticola]|nr:unnamed protein product [Cercospora beticola]
MTRGTLDTTCTATSRTSWTILDGRTKKATGHRWTMFSADYTSSHDGKSCHTGSQWRNAVLLAPSDEHNVCTAITLSTAGRQSTQNSNLAIAGRFHPSIGVATTARSTDVIPHGHAPCSIDHSGNTL